MRTKLRSKLMLLFMSLAMVVAFPAAAIADTLQINNTLVVGSNVSKDPGQSGTGKVWLETDDNKTDPQNGCNATLTSPVTVNFTSSDTNKIASPAPVTLTDCGTGAAKDFSYNVASSATAGTVQIGGKVSGGRGGTYTTTDTLTVTINAPAKENTGISNVSGSGTYGGNATLTAKLSSGSNNLSGKNVAFELNGQAVGTDATDANGVAELSGASLSGINAGPHNNAVSANFTGDSGYNGSSGSGNLSVAKANADIAVQGFNGVYDGTAKGASGTATGVDGSNLNSLLDLGASFTDVPGGTANWSFAGNANHNPASGSVQISINKAATITVVSCEAGPFTYNGSAHTPCSASVSGPGLNQPVSVDYQDNTNAGQATASASFAQTANYLGSSDSKNFTIAKATPTVNITWSNSTYDGNANAASATASGVGNVNLGAADELTYYAGTSASGTPLSSAPVNAGTYTVKAVFNGNTNYTSNFATQTITIAKAQAQVSLSNLTSIYDGTAKSATVTTDPSGLNVNVTYNSSAQAPTLVGSYAVVATVNDANYQGSANGTLTIGAWNLRGFHSPIGVSNSIVVAPGGAVPQATTATVWQTAKGGSTIPLKFNVFAGAVEKTATTDLKSFGAVKLSSCTASTNDPVDELSNAGSSSLRYDTTEGQFIQNWKTSAVSGDTCYRVAMTANDGSAIYTFVKLRK